MSITYLGSVTGSNVGSTSTGVTLDLSSLSLQQNDLVIVSIAVGSNKIRALSMVTTGYTDIVGSNLFGADTYYANLKGLYKFMGITPDSSVECGPSGATGNPIVFIAYAFRGVNTTTPLDVAYQTAIGSNTGRVTPPPITPTTSGSKIVCIGCGNGSTTAITASDLSSMATLIKLDNFSINSGIAYTSWTSGTFTPTQWTGEASSNSSWAAITIALREAPTGPANVKTINGLAIASVKTVNGLAIASVKSINGLS